MSENSSSLPILEFVAEAEEILQKIAELLHNIEKNGYNSAVVAELYRNLHTLKGSAQLFGFSQMGLLAHTLEASMEPLRQNPMPLKKQLIDVSFKSVQLLEGINKILNNEKSDKSFTKQVNALIPQIIAAATAQYDADFVIFKEEIIPDEQIQQKLSLAPEPGTVPVKQKSEKIPIPTPTPAPIPEMQKNEIQNQTRDIQMESKIDTTQNVVAPQIDATVRVQVTLLDQIMNLVGELVLVRNGVLQYKNKDDSLEYANLAHSIDEVATKLQVEVMKTRMQPVGSIVNKFQRLVRETAGELNKKIDLTLIGTETEIDKTLLEAIKDPLTHIIRNSCDHGIELPTDRKKAGKPENGHVLIRSYHEGGQVIIEVSDDGRGMDRERILAKSIEKGILTSESAAKLTEREILNLIFEPGFSTAQQVTNVSGRGVGMDVVRTNVEKIGGTVSIMSTFGKGSTIKLIIPLTLAILQTLIVKSNQDRYAIPQIKLVELVRYDLTTENGGDQIHMLQGRPMLKLRGELLPLIGLSEALYESKYDIKGKSEINIVIVNSEGENFGIIVDEIMETSDIVVKPLSSFLKNESLFSGATLLGDGAVSLILDIHAIADRFHIKPSGEKAKAAVLDSHLVNQKIVNSDAQDFFIFRVGSHTICAVPLCLVHRLEEFAVSAIEISGEQKMVRYRNSLMPLIDVTKALNLKREQNVAVPEKIQVFVIERSGRYFGLVVEEIIDVSFIVNPIDEGIRDRFGIMGNIMSDNQIYVVVDALAILEKEIKKIVGVSSQEELTNVKIDEFKNKKIKILVAEDVSFFRRQIGKILENAGFDVIIAEDGEIALNHLLNDSNGEIQMLLSDIEMPNRNGLELAREIKKQKQFKKLKMIALTTKNTEADIKEGFAAGFDEYLEKLNSDKLLEAIKKQLSQKV